MTDTPPSDAPDAPRPPKRAPSLLLVNTGDGKGKSTAAFGTALRAIARGWKVAVVQLLKSGEWKVGEEKVGRGLGIDWFVAGDGFTWESTDMDETQAKAVAAWTFARDLIAAGEHQLVILDEATYAMTWGWIDTAEVVAALRDRPPHVTVIVTGRDAPAQLIDAADTVTEMRKVKHAYDAGISARRGIDF
ncbi:MAG: cob(I)alamin adenosyltransferase [Actinomycetota bacterium]